MMQSKRSLRERLKSSNPVIALFSIVPAVEIIEMIGLAGFDAVILDTEHGPYSIDRLGPLVVAARACNIYSIARVRANEASLIGGVLDAGADGVLIPQIGSTKEAALAVSAARFAPEGTRGANPWVRAADYGERADWFQSANSEAAVFLMVEGKEGVAAAADIVRTPSLDGVFLGPVDLSHALGVPGEINHPKVVEQMRKVIDVASSCSVATAVFSPTPQGAENWIRHGARLIGLGVDTAHVLNGLKSVRASLAERLLLEA